MTASELDVLVPDPTEIRLSSGTFIEITDFQTIQCLRLLKIITRGAGPLLLELDINFGDDPETFGGKLIALVLMSVPEAEDETLAFLRTMVRPTGLIEGRPMSKDDQARNDALWADVRAAMANPALEDTIDIVEAIVRKVAPDLQSLGKRLGHLWSTMNPQAARKTTSQDQSSSGDSVEPSISSQQSTDGQIKSSSRYL